MISTGFSSEHDFSSYFLWPIQSIWFHSDIHSISWWTWIILWFNYNSYSTIFTPLYSLLTLIIQRNPPCGRTVDRSRECIMWQCVMTASLSLSQTVPATSNQTSITLSSTGSGGKQIADLHVHSNTGKHLWKRECP